MFAGLLVLTLVIIRNVCCFRHILASGSVDERVLLWDLEVKAPNTELTRFQDKIQSLTWHPVEGQTLLTGCADK